MQQVFGVLDPHPPTATPTLARSRSDSRTTMNGSAMAASTRSLTRGSSPPCSTPSSNTANSSPDRRAARSPGRRQARSRAVTSSRTLSPAA